MLARRWFMAVPIALAGCAGAAASDDEKASAEVHEWRLSRAPDVEIGAVDGPAEMLLHEARSSVRLADGRIVVLDAGSQQLRFYDATGRHLRSVGGPGSGPGEFRRPKRVLLTHPDSLLIYDTWPLRVSRFDSAGAFVWTGEPELAAPEAGAGEIWLHGGNLVQGPASVSERDAVRAVLDALSAAFRGFHYVRVDHRGRLWVSEHPWNAPATTQWRIHRRDGMLLARLETPVNFEIHETGDDYVLGRARDEMNVEYIRLYGLSAEGMTSRDPEPPSGASATAAVPEAVRQRMQSVLVHAQREQERFFSRRENSYRYAARADQLEWPEDMEGLEPYILEASERGYTILLFHASERVACGLTVGVDGPIGWTAGLIACR